jgi:hypothetical protein
MRRTVAKRHTTSQEKNARIPTGSQREFFSEEEKIRRRCVWRGFWG